MGEGVTCNRCGETKPSSEYYIRKTAQDKSVAGTRVEKRCKECVRERSRQWAKDNPERARENGRRYYAENKDRARDKGLQLRYGITSEQFEQMRKSQNQRCAICGRPEWENAKGTLFVDHCHTTGSTRELLCAKCNIAIGMLDERPEVLRAAIEYLKRHNV